MTKYRSLLWGAAVACLLLVSSPHRSSAQAQSGTTLKTETRLVIVDTIVTDKKGTYVRGLEQGKFRVWEDDEEQTIKSFSAESEAPVGKANQHYLVLFFDNSTLDLGQQTQARRAATKFIESNSGPNRLMAIVNFGGTLQLTQNFTSDTDRLKKVVSGVKFSSVGPGGDDSTMVASVGAAGLSAAAREFGSRGLLQALRGLAKNLAPVPGRKSLILLTGGMPLTSEITGDLTALINTCNKSNVAVYPIDARGLDAGGLGASVTPRANPLFRLASYVGSATLAPALMTPAAFMFQHPPGGGGGAPGGGGGSRPAPSPSPAPSRPSPSTPGTPGGSRPAPGGSTSTPGRGSGGGGGMINQPRYPNSPSMYNSPYTSRQIIPTFPPSQSSNQSILYSLAAGTGGFVIANSNDLLGGLEKIGRELNEYYLLGYTPTESAEGSCHTIKVKVEGGGMVVRARSGYCNVRATDLLAGSATSKELEARAAGTGNGNIHAAMLAPFFYTSPNTAKVNLAMEIPTDSIKFDKEKGKFHAAINVLGIISTAEGSVAARFSDTIPLQVEKKKDIEEFQQKPLHYENQFDVASGKYTMKVVFSSGGESFGRLEVPLIVEPYDGKQFSLSGIAIAKSVINLEGAEQSIDSALEERKALVSQGFQLIPTGTSLIKKTEKPLIYVEVYAPALLGEKPPMVGIQLRIVDRKTGEAKDDTGLVSLAGLIKPGSSVIPVGMGLPIAKLDAGAYRAELTAMDTAGHRTALRSAEFEVQ
ncbi:MAG: VWA domain-containing protein [Bryobacteraceae bacterium]